jgi:hypothetical protein
MKSVLILAALVLAAAPAKADLTHRIQSSVSLTVDAAASAATRIGSSYSVTGNNVTLDTAGGLGSLTAGSAVGYTPAAYSVTTPGDAFSFTEAFTEGDATPSATTVTSGVVGSLPMLGNTTTTAGGVAGLLDGSIASDHVISLTAGGAGTSAVGQMVTEVKID